MQSKSCCMAVRLKLKWKHVGKRCLPKIAMEGLSRFLFNNDEKKKVNVWLNEQLKTLFKTSLTELFETFKW